MITQTQKKSFWQSLLEAFELSAYRRVREVMMRDKFYRDTYRELSKLSDRELRDIGIHRGEIHSVAMESYLDNRVMP